MEKCQENLDSHANIYYFLLKTNFYFQIIQQFILNKNKNDV